jgi:Mn-dependent DtxR family transcriptional regulator
MVVHANDNSAWKAFEESELTHSAAHYLMTIMHLRKQNGYARVTDAAEHLKVSRGAASRAIALFKDRGWIQENEHRMLELTESGMELARSVERNYLILEYFLEEILSVPAEIAREDACKIEHLLSPQTAQNLGRLISVCREKPHLADVLRKHVAGLDTTCQRHDDCEICEEYDGCIAEDACQFANQNPGQAERAAPPAPETA